MYSLSAFKSYDIRGIRQKEIDQDFALHLWYSFALHLLSSNPNPKILLISDVRWANIPLIDNLLVGMGSAWIESVENYWLRSDYPSFTYGICGTSIGYYLGMNDYDVTIIVTASHNSKEYVGLKIVKKDASYYTSSELRVMFESNQIMQHSAKNAATIIQADLDTKLETLFSSLQSKFSGLQKKQKFVVDYGHGAGTHYEQQFISEYFGDLAIGLYTNPDGDFPAHETDTSRFVNYQWLLSEVSARKADFGLMFDGDVDRFGFVTSAGKIIKGDIVLAIVAHQLLTDGSMEKLWSNKVYQEVFCGNIVREIVEWNNGELQITRVGRGAFVAEVAASGALIAWEVSGHLLFKELGYIEMPLLVLYYVMKESELFDSFDAMIAHYDHNTWGQVLHFATEDKDGTIAALAKHYSDYPIITVDGIRVQLPYGRFCVRKSGTEPIIKVALEADSVENFDLLIAELRNNLKQLGCHEE